VHLSKLTSQNIKISKPMWILLEQIAVEGMLSMSQAPTKDFNRAFSSTSHPWNEQEVLHHPHYIALVSCSHRTARSPRDSPESPFVCRYPACCFHSGKGGVKPKARDGLMLARIGTRRICSLCLSSPSLTTHPWRFLTCLLFTFHHRRT